MSDEIMKALADFKDPETGRSVAQLGQVSDVSVEGDRASLTLALSTHSAPLWKQTQEECAAFLRQRCPQFKEVDVRPAVHPRPPQKLGQIGLAAKTVIAVGSGKGGVGKSTMAASLAYGLKRAGSVVGLMDADVYGPSIPHLVGVNKRPEIVEQKIQPIEVDGLKVMSMGFLVPPGEAVIWRGPMLHGAITQFLRDTDWGELDYLIIDMPPGTGDIALTLSQLLPLTGAVVVCTPQDVALLDAVKAIAMFRKVNIPVLGMIENMSYFLCPDCGKRYDIFGSGGAKKRAAELDVPFLGEVPINIQIRINGDEGRLAGNYAPAAGAEFFEAICYRLVRNLADAYRAAPPLPKLSVLA
ncbi:MAG TPA: Mrp/NBP35 family ATP-binding protein [Pirellulales bacterium]|nr:Mrp/NBP35 family ATP-binding protein [Pirellulales bacterium]